MNRKLPVDAYAHYLALGVERSYSKVASQFGVSKRAVLDAAKAERWQERVTDAENKSRDKATEAYVETLDQMNERHLKVLRFMLSRGIEGMKSMPVSNFTEAVRAATTAIDRERLIRGEPTERTENLETIVRREHDRWSKRDDEDEWADLMETAGEQPNVEPDRASQPDALDASSGECDGAVA